MIEFKGECGHVIRARDEDAGKVVRCAYCGKEAVAVLPPRDPEGSLLDAVEKTGVYDAQATRTSRKSARRRDAKRLVDGKPVQEEPDPFAVAMKMIYVAVIIIVLAVAWKYGSKAYETLMAQARPTPRPTTSPGPAEGPPPTQPQVGLVAFRLNAELSGAYVASVPPGAMIFHLPQWDAQDALFDDPLADKGMLTDVELRLAPGKHSLGLAMRINETSLMQVPGYPELRRRIEAAEDDDARLMGRYFVPDGSVGLRTVRIRGVVHLVRIYEIEVEPRTWVPVTALFLPRAPLHQLMGCLPQRQAFVFDTQQVRGELEYYEVPPSERADVLEALRRIGKVCYRRDENAPYRLFQIGLLDGLLTSENLGF